MSHRTKKSNDKHGLYLEKKIVIDVIDRVNESERLFEATNSKFAERDEESNFHQLLPEISWETLDTETQYFIRSPELEVITYRVLQVDNNNVHAVS